MASEPKKPPCIDIRTDVRKDERFAVLGEIAGYNRHEALGRMFDLWAWCRDRGLKDTVEELDGYIVAEAVVRRFLGARGVEAILGDGVNEFALAEQLEGGMLYLRGTSEYVAAARARIATSKAGGEARANGERNEETGRFVGKTTNVQPEHQPAPIRPPAGQPPEPQQTPASSSSLLPLPLSGSEDTHATRAIDGYAVARETWAAVAAARLELALELRIANVLAMSERFGMPSEPRACHDLRDRVREEGANAATVCKHVVANLIAQAREEKSIEWLSEKAFTAGGWQHARNWVPAQQRNRAPTTNGRPRVGAIGSATPRTDHGEDMKPAKEVM